MEGDNKSMVLNAPDFSTKCMKGDDGGGAKKLAVEWREHMAGISLYHPEEVLEALTFALGVRR
jgi:hypothetical protein